MDEPHGTRVTIELQAKFIRGRGSVDEYLTQTAIANPHIALHYRDPDNTIRRKTVLLSAVGRKIAAGAERDQAASVRRGAWPAGGTAHGRRRRIDHAVLDQQFFARVVGDCAEDLPDGEDFAAGWAKKMGREEAEALFQAIQATKIPPPATDCICPIGEDLILKGLHQVVPGEFYAAATRPPAVYRGNPFVIEVGLAYGGAAATQNVTKDLLQDLLEETRCPHGAAVSDQHFQWPGVATRRIGF